MPTKPAKLTDSGNIFFDKEPLSSLLFLEALSANPRSFNISIINGNRIKIDMLATYNTKKEIVDYINLNLPKD